MLRATAKISYTANELCNEMAALSHSFDIVRLISPEDFHVCHLKNDSLSPGATCYSLWNRTFRCEHCPSFQDTQHTAETRIDILNGQPVIVFARDINLEGRKLILEMITELTEHASPAYAEPAFVEIQHLRNENSRLIRDPLTHCYSRHYVDTCFDQYVQKAQSLSQELCLALFDLDNLKAINDRYGHSIGDEVLKSCCHFWLKYFDTPDSFITRYGGDEFMIIALRKTYEEFCQHVTQLSGSMRKNIVLEDGNTIPFSFTIGCSCMSEVTSCTDKSPRMLNRMFDLADSRMYQGKNGGKNCIIAH